MSAKEQSINQQEAEPPLSKKANSPFYPDDGHVLLNTTLSRFLETSALDIDNARCGRGFGIIRNNYCRKNSI